MNQAHLALQVAIDTAASAPADRTGFDIGWDHAHHGLVPPAELLHPGTPVCQGWMAGKAVFCRRTLASSRHTRLWLQLRLLAWRRGIGFDTLQVTPNYLSQIDTPHCPVRRCALGGAVGQPDAAVVVRLNPNAGFAAGNLAVMSAQAAAALDASDAPAAVRHARSAEASGEPAQGLSAAAWWRVAALRAFTTPLPFADVARLPLALLPPNRVRLLNAAQGLQALVTQMFSSAGWSSRCRALAQLLPEHTLRHDFNLFVGAMAPRVLEAGNEPAALRRALEDAWLQDRVQRRWQHLVLSLGEAATAGLLDQALRAAGTHPKGLLIVQHAPDLATEGWSIKATPLVAPFVAPFVAPAAAPGPAPRSRTTPRLRSLSPAAPRAARPETAAPPAAPASRA